MHSIQHTHQTQATHYPREIDLYAKGLKVIEEVYQLAKNFPKWRLFALNTRLKESGYTDRAKHCGRKWRQIRQQVS